MDRKRFDSSLPTWWPRRDGDVDLAVCACRCLLLVGRVLFVLGSEFVERKFPVVPTRVLAAAG